ncbi:MAG: RHS repeat protein, partial [Candidatus Omnitrophica bacterium]|nr:RHS repeat protein [Candidatus Omnitrophota bacterium]
RQNDQLTGFDYNAWHKGFEYYTNSSFLKKITDIDGQEVEYIYDDLGRLDSILSRNGNIKTTINYQFGNPNSVSTTTVYSDAPTQTSIKEFDGLGRVTKEYLNGVLKHEYRYDQYNRIEEETYLPGNFTNYKYDGSPLNRVIRQNFPDYSFTRTEYGSESNYYKVSSYDEKGNKTDNLTDILGRKHKIRDALGGITQFVYDERSNLDTVITPEGMIYSYAYDLRNRLVFKKMPGQDKGQVFGYFDDDLMEFSIDGNGNRIDYEYDTYKRVNATYLNSNVTNWVFPDQNYGTKGSMITSNAWYSDAGGGITVNKLQQSMAKMADLNGQVTTYFDQYDAFGRLKKQREVYPLLQKSTNTDSIEFTYNHADWLLRERRVHDGYTPLTTYRDHSYDEFGRMIFDGLFPDFSFETGLVFNMTYNDRDQMVTKKLGGITNPLDKIRYDYNERGWLTQMNDPVYRKDSPEFCDDPPTEPNTTAVEQTVDFEDLLDLIVSEPDVVIGPVNPCTSPPCYEVWASYNIKVVKPANPVGSKANVVVVDACIEALYGEDGPISGPEMHFPYCLFSEN